MTTVPADLAEKLGPAPGIFSMEIEQTIPLIVAGPGVKAGGRIEAGSIGDVAPTLCRLLRVNGESFQGRVLGESLA